MYESYSKLDQTISLLRDIEAAFNEKAAQCNSEGKKYFYHGMVETRRMIDFLELRLNDLYSSSRL